MYADFHIHTHYSSDSDALPEAQIRQAIALGMPEICITDHQDFDFPPGDLDFQMDTEDFFTTMPQLQVKYADQIQLRLGVELGLQMHLGETLENYSKKYPFDFIIGSVHVLNGMDCYDPACFEGRQEEEVYRQYFETVLANLKQYNCYNVAGHIDYIVRHGPNKNRYYNYVRYAGLLDEILKTLIEKGKGLECNTAGLKAGLGHPNPAEDILKRYLELGGEILTLGSDAHEPSYIGYEFPYIKRILQECGFRYYTTYAGGTPTFHRL